MGAEYFGLVERLRRQAIYADQDRAEMAADHLREAADALEALLKEVEELRRQLKERGEQ
jgi:hypothetical protein